MYNLPNLGMQAPKKSKSLPDLGKFRSDYSTGQIVFFIVIGILALLASFMLGVAVGRYDTARLKEASIKTLPPASSTIAASTGSTTTSSELPSLLSSGSKDSLKRGEGRQPSPLKVVTPSSTSTWPKKESPVPPAPVPPVQPLAKVQDKPRVTEHPVPLAPNSQPLAGTEIQQTQAPAVPGAAQVANAVPLAKQPGIPGAAPQQETASAQTIAPTTIPGKQEVPATTQPAIHDASLKAASTPSVTGAQTQSASVPPQTLQTPSSQSTQPTAQPQAPAAQPAQTQLASAQSDSVVATPGPIPVAQASDEQPVAIITPPAGAPAKAVKAPVATDKAPPRGGYAIQVAAFAGSTKDKKGMDCKRRLEQSASRYEVRLMPSEDKKYIRVLVGHFTDKQSAMEACQDLKKKPGFSDSIVKAM